MEYVCKKTPNHLYVLGVPNSDADYTKDIREVYQYMMDKNIFNDFLIKKAKEALSKKRGSGYDLLTGRKEIESFTYKGMKFYKTYTPNKARMDFIIELPTIYDDDDFVWKDNEKYDAKETSIVDGMFQYDIIYNNNGDVHIDVKYNKCDNYHRNKVTIAEIVIKQNGSNDNIRDAIKTWKEKFIEEILAA